MVDRATSRRANHGGSWRSRGRSTPRTDRGRGQARSREGTVQSHRRTRVHRSPQAGERVPQRTSSQKLRHTSRVNRAKNVGRNRTRVSQRSRVSWKDCISRGQTVAWSLRQRARVTTCATRPPENRERTKGTTSRPPEPERTHEIVDRSFDLANHGQLRGRKSCDKLGIEEHAAIMRDSSVRRRINSVVQCHR